MAESVCQVAAADPVECAVAIAIFIGLWAGLEGRQCQPNSKAEMPSLS